MSACSTVATPTGPRGFVTKVGTLAAGTALAGSAVFGGAVVAPTITADLTGTVQHDIMLTAGAQTDTFVASLQNLLNALNYGDMGQVLGLFGSGISTSSDLSVLLAALNPDNMSLDTATMQLLSTDISGLLADVKMTGPDNTVVTLGSVPIDQLIGSFIGGTGANESIGDVLTSLGFGPYVGLLDLPFLNLSPSDTVGALLADFMGITSTDTLNDLVINSGTGATLGDATIASLMGITSAQLSEGWDKFVDGLTVGGTIMDPGGTGTLGDETLGALLTALLGPGASLVTDDTTLTTFLGDLGLFTMLGLS